MVADDAGAGGAGGCGGEAEGGGGQNHGGPDFAEHDDLLIDGGAGGFGYKMPVSGGRAVRNG